MITSIQLVLVSMTISFTIGWSAGWLVLRWAQAKRRGKLVQAYVEMVDWMASNYQEYLEKYIRHVVNEKMEWDEAYQKWIAKE